MTQAEFVAQFHIVIEAFGSSKFPIAVLERMHKRCSDLSMLEMGTLCNLIIDNCDRAPTTMKLNEFASIVRSRRERQEQEYNYTNNCSHCHDCGITRIQPIGESIDLLMKCDCREGALQTSRLPRYERSVQQFYRRLSLPLEWFKPDWQAGTLYSKQQSFHQKVEYWKQKIKISEAYWAKHIPELRA